MRENDDSDMERKKRFHIVLYCTPSRTSTVVDVSGFSGRNPAEYEFYDDIDKLFLEPFLY